MTWTLITWISFRENVVNVNRVRRGVGDNREQETG